MSIEKPIRLKDSNPYAGGAIIVFEDGTQILEAQPKRIIKNPKFQEHLVVDGDELTVLAWKYYGNLVPDAGKYWKVIAEENNLEKAHILEDMIGEKIRIPDILQWKIS